MTKFLEALLVILFWMVAMLVGASTKEHKKTKAKEFGDAILTLINIIMLAWVISRILVG